MRGQIDIKSATIGVVLGVSMLLLAGAAGGNGDTPPIGRFQIACTNTLCYLVDTATGQVWMTGDPDFRASKLQGPSPVATTPTLGFVGRWVSEEANNNFALQLDADGRAIATNESSRYEGHWSTQGTSIVIAIENEAFVGELQLDDRLVLAKPGEEEDRIVLKRATP